MKPKKKSTENKTQQKKEKNSATKIITITKATKQ